MALVTLGYWTTRVIEVVGGLGGIGLLGVAGVACDRYERWRRKRCEAPLERAQARMAEIRIRTLARMEEAERRWPR